MASVSVADIGTPAVQRQTLWRYWRGSLRGSEFIWAAAFLVPYIGVFFAFVIYPVGYGLWMGSDPALYTELFSDPIYQNNQGGDNPVVYWLLTGAIGPKK